MIIYRRNITPNALRLKTFGLTLAMGASLLPYTQAFALDDNALPSGGTVTGGSATIDYSAPGRLDVYQGSDRAVINWDSFNIGTSATTQFYQPSRSSVVVNRVTGSGDPSQILGTLKANGTVFVLDKNGVVFGENSVVDVGSIVVTTGNINDADFMNGEDQIRITGIDTGGSIINKGTITAAEAGLAAFVAPTVVNDGVIQARMGRVALAAGTVATVDLYGDGLVEVAADAPLQQALITNNGIIRVSGGYALLTASGANEIVKSAINNNGVIDVSSVSTDGGKIVLEGSGDIIVNGTLDASGATGGGEILVGGDYQGGGSVQHSQTTTISDLALLRANTTGANGNGGKVIVWSDNKTKVAGTIEANAGNAGGNGGSIETSSKDKLNVTNTAKVSASAPNGKNGEWLLDPRNVILQNTAGTSAAAGGTINAGSDNETVNTGTIETALNNGLNVTITTGSTGAQDGDITVQDSITKSAGTDSSFTLQAAHNIYVNNDIKSTVGKLNLTLNSDSDVNHDGGIKIENVTIATNGGYFVAGGGNGALGGLDGILGNGDGTGADDAYAYGNSPLTDNGFYLVSSTINTAGGNVYINGASTESVSATWGINSWNSSINSGAGNIKMRGDVSGVTGSYDSNYGVMIQGNTHLNTTSGNIDIAGTGAQSDNGYNVGVYVTSSTLETTSGNLALVGNGGKGDNTAGVVIESNSHLISGGSGDITVHGTGGLGNDSDGIFMDTSSIAANGGGNIVVAGTGSVLGQVGDNGLNLRNVTFTSASGDIRLTGTGGGDGTNGFNTGIYTENSTYTVTGNGDVIWQGTGGGGTGIGEHNAAIWLENTTITNAGGDISFSGTATSHEADGVKIKDNSSLISNGAGDIILYGTGGIGYDSTGVLIYSGNSIQSNGTGDISITGISGTTGADDMDGVWINGSDVKSVSGDITITGTGGGDGSNHSNSGITIDNGSTIQATTSGDITLHGTGGKGDNSDGIYTDSSVVQSGQGDITVTGIGGIGNYSGGVKIFGTDFITGSTGKITMIGTTDTTFQNEMRGIEIGDWFGDLTTIQTDRGNIELTGTGGGDGTGNSNFGIFMRSSSVISVTNDGNIILNGTGGYGSDADGTHMESNTSITNVDGDISITGKDQFGNNHNDEDGLVLNDTTVSTSGAGNISLDGSVAYSDSGAIGLRFIDSSATTSGTGNITLTGNNTGANGTGLVVTGTSIISSVKTLTARIRSLFYDNNSSFSAGTDMILKPHAASENVGIASGTGDLILDDNFLNDITVARTLIIGDSATGIGNINISNWDLSAESYHAQVFGRNIDIDGLDLGAGNVWMYAKNGTVTNSGDTNTNAAGNLTLLAGDDITVNEDLINAGTGHINLFAGWDGTSALQIPSLVDLNNVVVNGTGHDITLGTNGKVSSAGAGTSVLLAAGDKFINNASLGAAAIDSGTGRFLIYSNREDTTISNGLLGIDPNIYGQTYTSLLPSGITGGSRFIYAFDPNAPLGGGGTGSGASAQISVDNQASNIQTLSVIETKEEAAKAAGCLASEGESGRCIVE